MLCSTSVEQSSQHRNPAQISHKPITKHHMKGWHLRSESHVSLHQRQASARGASHRLLNTRASLSTCSILAIRQHDPPGIVISELRPLHYIKQTCVLIDLSSRPIFQRTRAQTSHIWRAQSTPLHDNFKPFWTAQVQVANLHAKRQPVSSNTFNNLCGGGCLLLRPSTASTHSESVLLLCFRIHD
jgi:hypothetical protein